MSKSLSKAIYLPLDLTIIQQMLYSSHMVHYESIAYRGFSPSLLILTWVALYYALVVSIATVAAAAAAALADRTGSVCVRLCVCDGGRKSRLALRCRDRSSPGDEDFTHLWSLACGAGCACCCVHA